VLAYLPSPSSGAIHLGPLQLRAYGLCIALGVWAAVAVTSRRYGRRGGDPALITTIALWAVPAGIVGARIYHVITDYELYFGSGKHPLDALKIWDGGLGIWGGVALGVLAGAWVARRQGADVPLLFDCVAPALPLAQAIGRWGNWWNQELFGKPTTLPWALKIDVAHRPLPYVRFATFTPTFLYESLWDLCVVGIVLLVERKARLRKGSLLAVYVVAYTFGRFFTEYERIDFAHKIGPLRLNDWVSIIVFLGGAVGLVVYQRGQEHAPLDPSGDETESAASSPDQSPAASPASSVESGASSVESGASSVESGASSVESGPSSPASPASSPADSPIHTSAAGDTAVHTPPADPS
jgi:prolipoprotein diacylglyceryl transferase